MFWNPNGCSVVGVASGSWWMGLRGEERQRGTNNVGRESADCSGGESGGTEDPPLLAVR